jgi:hypothetical protein
MKNETAAFMAGYKDRQSKVSEMMDNTSSDARRAQVNVSGVYRMKVRAIAGKDKEGKPYQAPDVFVSSNKGYLCLKVMLEVVDGTDAIQKGATVYHNINLLPPKDSDEEVLQRTLRFMKPTIAALTGVKDFQIDQKFMDEYLSIEHDANFKITKQHKMTQEVMCVVEPRQYQNEIRYSVVSLAPARPGDHSVSRMPTEAEAAAASTPTKLKKPDGADAKQPKSASEADQMIADDLKVPEELKYEPNEGGAKVPDGGTDQPIVEDY